MGSKISPQSNEKFQVFSFLSYFSLLMEEMFSKPILLQSIRKLLLKRENSFMLDHSRVLQMDKLASLQVCNNL